MTLLSVNINKIALLRNSRGTGTPDLVEGARLAIAGGAEGITVHPREDQRHITLDDVIAVADLPEIKSGQVEFNVEGDMREDLFNMIRVLKPTQFTVVPVIAGGSRRHEVGGPMMITTTWNTGLLRCARSACGRRYSWTRSHGR